MSTDSSLILCNHQQQFLHQISFLPKRTPHPLQRHGRTTLKPKIFTPTMMKFWKKSFILTLPLQLASPKLHNDDVQLRLRHLFMKIKRSLVLTLPLPISSHMLMLFIALINAYLRLHQLARLSPRTVLPHGRARSQARLLSSVQKFTCLKSPLTRFQF